MSETLCSALGRGSLTACKEQLGANHATSNGHFGQEKRRRRLLQLFAQTLIVPAVRNPELLEAALAAPGKLVYLLCGDLENIETMLKTVNSHGKTAVVNVDLMSGMPRNRAAVSYLARHGALGIISTHLEPLREAQKFGLFAIQRTFMIDSGAVQTLLKSLAQLVPDALEAMPAMAAPKLIARLPRTYGSLPILAGGLVDSMQEADYCFRKGVQAISVGDQRLWAVLGKALDSGHGARGRMTPVTDSP